MKEDELPPGWAWSTLGELGDYTNGRGFKKAEWSPSGLPIIRIQNLTGTSSTFNYFTGDLDPAHRVKPGDLLIAWAATIGAHLWKGPEGALNQHIFKVSPWINKKFLYYLINFKLGELLSQAHGSGMVHLTRSKFEGAVVAVPPMAEQERIVDALEDHLSRLDAADKTLLEVEQKTDLLQRSMLATAFSTSDHEVVRLEEVAEVRLGRQRSPKNHSGDSMRPYIRAANVGWNGLLLGDVKEMNFSDKEAETYRLQRGDILMNEASGSPGEVGKPVIWNNEIPGCCFQNTLIRLRPFAIDSSYLYNFMKFEALRGAFRSGARGVGIHHLGAARVAKWMIPLPTPEVQSRIVEFIESSINRVSLLRSQIGSASGVGRRSRRLRELVFAEAFSGRMVRQDPSDEPAQVMIERSKASLVKTKRRRASKAAVDGIARPAPSISSEPAGTFVQEELGL